MTYDAWFAAFVANAEHTFDAQAVTRTGDPPSISFGDISYTIFHAEDGDRVELSVEDLSRAPGDMIRGRKSFDCDVATPDAAVTWVLDVIDPY